jgi:hypothetical protein
MDWENRALRTEVRDAKKILRTSLHQASEEKLFELLGAARRLQMPYQSCQRCYAVRLFGVQGIAAYERARHDFGFFKVERSYMLLAYGPPCGGTGEAMRQRRIIPMIRAELRTRTWTRRASAYFAAAEDQAYFWLSLSTRDRPTAEQIRVASMIAEIRHILFPHRRSEPIIEARELLR